MKWIWYKVLHLIFFVLIIYGCNEQNSALKKETDKEEKQENSVFHQVRALSIGDSLEIRILSWGGKETGSYLVLLADSAGGHFPGSSFYRTGEIQNAWADDLDRDGWPEVAVVLQEQSGRKFTSLKLHELSEGFDFRTITMPALNEAMGSDYGGYDTLYRSGEDIIREFSLLNRADSTAENKERRQIIYHFENDQLVPGISQNLPVVE